MRIFFAIFPLTVLWLSACLPAPDISAPGGDFQTVTPRPTLAAFAGISALPAGQFLFVAVTGYQEYSSACDLPPVAAMQEPFAWYGENTLELNWSAYRGEPQPQRWADFRAENALLALVAFYQLNGGKLETFSALPFKLPGTDSLLSGVDENGGLALQTPAGLIHLGAGESVSLQALRSGQGDCRILDSIRIDNFGLLRDEQVTFR